jgi:hypothetical protein
VKDTGVAVNAGVGEVDTVCCSWWIDLVGKGSSSWSGLLADRPGQR